MCDEDSRCRVRHHRPGTICPYTKQVSRGSGYASREPTKFTQPVVKKSIPARAGSGERPEDLRPWRNSGVCVIVLLGMWFLAAAKTGGTVTLWVVLIGVLLVLVPARIASHLMYRCHAWLNDGTRRCQKPRKGFLSRCRHHQGQAVIACDVAAAIASLVAAVNFLVAIRILTHASAIDLLPASLSVQ